MANSESRNELWQNRAADVLPPVKIMPLDQSRHAPPEILQLRLAHGGAL